MNAGLAAVERGRMDVAGVSLEHTEAIEALEDFKARNASQYHLHSEQATVLAFLNVTHPPFDDVRVRRAVNFAIDRAAISAFVRPGVRPADVSASPAGHRRLPPLLPVHRRSGRDGRVEGARPRACPPPRRRFGDAGHERDRLDVPGLLGSRRTRGGSSARGPRLPGEDQRAEDLEAYVAKVGTRRRGVCRRG